MEAKYNIICYSRWRFAVPLLSLLLLQVPITAVFWRLGTGGRIVIGVYAIFVVVMPLFVLPRYVAKAVLQITCGAEGFQFCWTKPFWGSRAKPALVFGLDELRSYKYEASYNFDTLRIRLRSGVCLKLHRWFNDCDDDFDKFMTHLRHAVDRYNARKGTVTPIEMEKSIMENRTFLIVTGVIIGIIIVATILLTIFKGIHSAKGFVPILVVLGPLVWVMSRVIKGLRSTKT
jgi:hypothetical protein